MERVVVVFMDEDPTLAALRAGDIDVGYVHPTKAKQDIAGYAQTSYPTVDSRGISLPVGPAGDTADVGGRSYAAGNDVTTHRAIRQALNYAVDRNTMVDNVLDGHARPAFSVADGMPWGSEAVRVENDADRARQILADDGWTADADGVLARAGVRAEIDLLYPANDSARQALAVEFSRHAEAIGIAVNPVGLSWDEIYERQYSTPVLWGWGSNSPTELYNLTHSEGWGNFPRHESEKVDQHLDEAVHTSDLDESFEQFRLAQETPEGHGPEGAAAWVWLVNVDHVYYVRDGLNIAEQELHPHGHGWSLVNDIDQWLSLIHI